jgi:hypothetical protein
MSITKFLIIPLITTLSIFVHGERPLHMFGRACPTPSLAAIIDFLREYRYDYSLCDSITYLISIKRDAATPPLEWIKIVGVIADIVHKAQIADDNNMHWADIFGLPIKESLLACGNQTGIHGSMDIQFNKGGLEHMFIKIRLYHEDFYDPYAWRTIIKAAMRWMEQCNRHGVSCFDSSPLYTMLKTDHALEEIKITFKDKENNKLFAGFTSN